MSRFLIRMRMVLGGAICGTFLGLLLGGLSGAAYGAHIGNHSYGLRGAISGGLVCCLLGTLYGGILRPPSRTRRDREDGVRSGDLGQPAVLGPDLRPQSSRASR